MPRLSLPEANWKRTADEPSHARQSAIFSTGLHRSLKTKNQRPRATLHPPPLIWIEPFLLTMLLFLICPARVAEGEQLTRKVSQRSAMEQGRLQKLVSLQNGGNLQSSASLSIRVAKRMVHLT